MDTQQPIALILGANGRLGRPLVEAFAREGWQVRAQMRNADRWRDKTWPDGVEPWFCDAYVATELKKAAQGVSVIINALNPTYDQWKKNAEALAENALSAARDSGALLLFPGNIYNYGSELPEQLREETLQVGNTIKGQIRIAIEKRLREAVADGVNCVVLRTGDYFGDQARGSWLDLVITKKLHKGILVYPGPFDIEHAWTYLPDFALAFVRVAHHVRELQGFHTYNFPGYAFTGVELQRTLEKILNHPLKLRRMPWWTLRLAAPFYPMANSLLEMRYLWECPHRIEDGPLSKLIGPLPSTPLHDAMEATINGLGLNKPQG